MPQAQPITKGNVFANFHEEMQMLCTELDQRRALAEDLAAWWAEQPEAEQAFREFVDERRRRETKAARKKR